MSGAPARIGLAEAAAIGLNGIVGSGIFLLPGVLFLLAGPLSILALPLCGIVCLAVGLCFGELASLAGKRAGGPYRYAELAFGPAVGGIVGSLAIASGVLGWAAVTRGLADRLAPLLPGPLAGLPAPALAAGIILALVGVNLVGLRPGVRLTQALTLAKLLPLIALATVGLFYVEPARLFVAPPSGEGAVSAIFLCIFLLAGFEYAAVPAADAKDPARDVPRALGGAIGAAIILYALLQLVFVGTVADPANAKAPLEASALVVFGPAGALVLGAAATVSMLGFSAGSALIAPRYVAALAEDGLLPAVLARRSARTNVPAFATIVLGVVAAGLAASLDFRQLVDTSTVAVVAQYVPACLAVPVLRRRLPDAPRAFRLPAGGLVAIATAGLLFGLAAVHVSAKEALVSFALAAPGAILALLARRRAHLAARG